MSSTGASEFASDTWSCAEMGIWERLAFRAVTRSPEYEALGGSFLRESAPLIAHLGGRTFALALDQPTTDERLQQGAAVFPYVLFLVDPAKDEILEAYRVNPELTSSMLHVESLLRAERFTMPMRSEVAMDLPLATSESPRGASTIKRIAPKVECDESLAYPRRCAGVRSRSITPLTSSNPTLISA